MKCIGPRGLQNLIEDRRKNGLIMPFKVSIRKNSRLALVGWENVDYTPPVEREVQYDEWGYEIEQPPGEGDDVFQVGEKILDLSVF